MTVEKAERRQQKEAKRRAGERIKVEGDEEADQAAIDAVFGTTNLDDPKIITAEEIVTFDKYFDFQEGLNYILLLHIMRMMLLVKVVNKSQNLKF